MQIEIKPEDIDKYVKQAILDSTVGKSLVDNIEKSIKDLMGNYNSPVKNFINDQLRLFTEEYMQRPEIKSMVIATLTKVITPEVVETIVTYGVAELTRRYKEKDTW